MLQLCTVYLRTWFAFEKRTNGLALWGERGDSFTGDTTNPSSFTATLIVLSMGSVYTIAYDAYIIYQRCH